MSGNAKLTLIVDGTLSVYGGAAGDGADSTGVNPPGGTGGFAGIFVPNGTTLTVRGGGTLSAYGGHGGDGGNGVNNDMSGGGGGGGGAGAGIGGNGGAGGAAELHKAKPGGKGESAGEVYLYETVGVTAYGGAGGSGGDFSASAPGGGGGYPAAGIGGGGAGSGGANHGAGGGGFSGGRGDTDAAGTKVVDGVGAPAITYGPGGGYFSSYDGTYEVAIQPALGGGSLKYNDSAYGGDSSGGNGGAAGSGGTLKKSSTATLTVSNGSYKTATKQWGVTPTPIYAQSGYSLTKLREAGVRVVDAGLTANGVRSKGALEAELGAKGKTLIPTGLPGVGSGAGFTESATEYVRDGSYLVGQVMILEAISNFLLWRIPRFTTECVEDYVYLLGRV